MSHKITARDLDARVTWAPGCQPPAFPHSHGTLFSVVGRMAFVTWEGGDGRPVPVATVALVTA